MKLADFNTSWHDLIHATGAQWLAAGFVIICIVVFLALAAARISAESREHIREDKAARERERLHTSVRIGPFGFWK